MTRVEIGIGSPGPAGPTGPPGVGANWRGIWSGATTYALGDGVQGADGRNYISVVASNLNHNPVGDAGVHWSDLLQGGAIVSSPNTFTAVPQTFNQPSGGGTPLIINVNAARANIEDVLFRVNTNASYGAMPVFIDNWGQIATPGFITATGSGGVGPVGGYSWMIAAVSDLGASQPTFVSQVGNTNNWHFLCQNGNQSSAFLVSGGSDHPLGAFGETSPVLKWANTAPNVFDTKLYRWSTNGLVAEPGFAILNAAGSSAILRWGDKTSGEYWRMYYDGTDGLFIRDNRHAVTLITLGANGTGSLGFFGSFGAVQPVAGIGSNFTAGAGTAMNSASSSTGGTGASAYTFADIVRALKNVGLVAA